MKDLDVLQPDLAKKIIDIVEDGNVLELEHAYDEALVKAGIISQQQLRTARRFSKSFAKAKGCY